MTQSAHLAIDLGAESGRTIVGLLDGEQLTLHETHRFLHLPRALPSGLHWDITGLWGEIMTGCRKSMQWARENNITITSLGVDCWGVDWGVLDRSGDLLMLPRCYRDSSHTPAYEKALDVAGKEFLWDQTGIQFMFINTLYQVYARHLAE